MSKLTCRLVSLVSEGGPTTSWVAAHRDRCLHCQADAVRGRGLSRELNTMSSETVAAPDEIQGRVMARLGVQDASNPRRPIVVRVIARYAAAALAGIATAAAVAAGLTRRGSTDP